MVKTRDTWSSCDVHGFQVPGFNDCDGQSAGGWKIAEWKHQVAQVHIILQHNHTDILNNGQSLMWANRTNLLYKIIYIVTANYILNLIIHHTTPWETNRSELIISTR